MKIIIVRDCVLSDMVFRSKPAGEKYIGHTEIASLTSGKVLAMLLPLFEKVNAFSTSS